MVENKRLRKKKITVHLPTPLQLRPGQDQQHKSNIYQTNLYWSASFISVTDDTQTSSNIGINHNEIMMK